MPALIDIFVFLKELHCRMHCQIFTCMAYGLQQYCFLEVGCNKFHRVHHTFLKLSDSELFYIQWVWTVTKLKRKGRVLAWALMGLLWLFFKFFLSKRSPSKGKRKGGWWNQEEIKEKETGQVGSWLSQLLNMDSSQCRMSHALSIF